MKFKIVLIGIAITMSHTIMAQKAKIVYPLVMSFQSECCGVPSDSALQEFIKKFKARYKINKITADRIGPMGREGEYYLAFRLKELSKKQKQYFIKNIKAIKKFPSDKGTWSFKEKEEIDPSSLPGRSRITEKVF